MDQHVKRFCGIVFLELRRIGHFGATYLLIRLRSWFHLSFCKRQDYCNSLLESLPENRLDRLQRVQHNAACLVLGRRRRDHAKPLLRSLHWLPVRGRIEYKISTCALGAELHLLLPICLIFSLCLIFPLFAFRRLGSHGSSKHQN